MWMMGYSDGGGGEINTINQDPFSGRKLRPLMPRPAINPPCLTRIHGTDFLTLNHHLAMEQNKRDLTTQQQQVVVSSRWNPTPEQLQTLEELYRRGTRTPSADQIQHITAQLRRYGKIEGKNVFYWFQNHKARERQKRRRQLDDEQTTEKREPAAAGGNRTAFEVEQTKNWASPTNSSTLAEKAAEAECKGADDGWVQFDDDAAEPQRRRNATWRGMNLSPSSCAPTTVTSALPSAPQMKPQDFLNIFLEPYARGNLVHSTTEEEEEEAAQTLQLFPLRSCSSDGEGEEEEEEESGAAMNNDATTHDVIPNFQFFEFLPLKN